MFATDSSPHGIAYLILTNAENQIWNWTLEELNLFFASIFMPQWKAVPST